MKLDILGHILSGNFREAQPGRGAKGVNVELLDAILRRQVVIANVEDELIKRVARDYRAAARSVARAITDAASRGASAESFSQQLRGQIAGQVRGVIERLREQLAEDFDDVLSALWQAEIESGVAIFQRAIPDDALNWISFTRPNAGTFITSEYEVLGQSLDRWGRRVSRHILDELGTAIRRGEIEGADMRSMIARTAEVFKTSRRGAVATARTAVQSVANDAAALLYERNDDIIDGVQYEATFDKKTCPTCAGYDGRTYRFSDGTYASRPRTPVHMQCRCVYVPIVKTWRELGIPIDEVSPGTRASMNGQVPGTIGFAGWLRTQPNSVANAVLGRGRADLWRKGKADLGAFVNERTSRPIALRDIKRKLEAATSV